MSITFTKNPQTPSHSQFLYPSRSRTGFFTEYTGSYKTIACSRYDAFPFDSTCEKIVRTLESKNWSVEGMEVTFCDSGSGEEKKRYVSTIRGKDFGFSFDCLGSVKKMIIPKEELRVYSDEIGPTYLVYVGEDWEKDKSAFLDLENHKMESCLKKEKRTYLVYSGTFSNSCDKKAPFPLNKRALTLINDTNGGREYAATEKDPKEFKTKEVFLKFKKWLEENVLKKIEEAPL